MRRNVYVGVDLKYLVYIYKSYDFLLRCMLYYICECSLLYAYRNGGISDRATRVDKVFVQPPWDTSEAAVEPIEEYNTTLFMQNTGVWYDYDKTQLWFFNAYFVFKLYTRDQKLSSQAQLQWKNWLPLSLRLQLKSAGWSDLQISCFLLSIPCLERDRVSKTDGDQWSISFPKTKTMRLKIGSWKMFFVVTLLCFFFSRCYVSFFVGVLLKDQQGLFWISTQEYLSWGYQFPAPL